MPPSRIERRRKSKAQGNVFKDTRVGKALSDALGAGAGKVKDALSTPSNYDPYSEQSFAERTGRKPKFTRRKAKPKSTPESRRRAKDRNDAEARGKAEGRIRGRRKSLAQDSRIASSKNQARKGAAEMIQGMDRELYEEQAREEWNSLFDHMEAMGSMPDATDTDVLEEVLAPESSSSSIPEKEVEDVAGAIEDDAEDVVEESRDFVGEFGPELAQPTGADLLSYGVEQPFEAQGPPDMRDEMFDQGGGSGPYIDQPADARYDEADPRDFNPDAISLGPSTQELEDTLAGRMKEEGDLARIKRLTTAVQLGDATGDEYFELQELMRDMERREPSPRIQREIPPEYGAKRGAGPYAVGYPDSEQQRREFRAREATGQTVPEREAELAQRRLNQRRQQERERQASFDQLQTSREGRRTQRTNDRPLSSAEQRAIAEAERQGRRALSSAQRRAAARRSGK